MLLAVTRIPADLGAIDRAAAAAGLARADASRRLTGTLPRVLLLDTSGERIAIASRALEAAGFDVITCDPAQVPTDDERVLARRLETTGGRLWAFDAVGRRHEYVPAGVMLIQRGVRVETATKTVKSAERQLSMGRAVMSGGLAFTKQVEKTRTVTTETRESFLLVQRCDGEPDLILYERRLDYRFLGAAMLPSSSSNLESTLRLLRRVAPAAPVDERVARPGFVSGLPATAADPVDLALHLVALAHLRG